MTKVNLSKLVLKNIEGVVIKDHDAHKLIANTIYHSAKNLDLIEKAMLINKGKEVELTTKEKDEMIEIIKNANNIAAFVKKAVIEYLNA